MYDWRKMSEKERAELLQRRINRRHPRHSPPHFASMIEGSFHLSAACFEHSPFIGTTLHRLETFKDILLTTITPMAARLYAWCILPNHYHLLLDTSNLPKLLWTIGQMHGRLSRNWNSEDNHPKRKVWCKCSDRGIRSERHFWATINYIHHNPIKHGHASHWQEWPFSSAEPYLNKMGRNQAKQIWEDYPILDYGKGWDD